MTTIYLVPSGGDDQPQIQDAINSLLPAGGGVIRLSAGNYTLGSTLVIGSDAAPSAVEVTGEGPLVTSLHWTGTGPNAIQVNRQKYSRLQGFALYGSSAAVHANQNGIAFVSGNLAVSGTASNGGVLDQLIVQSFGVGLSVGQGQWQASEWIMSSVDVSYCPIGATFNGYNTLNFELQQPGFNNCNLALQMLSGSSIALRGGSFSNNGKAGCGLGWDGNGGDIFCKTGKFVLSNVRSESCQGTPFAFQSTDVAMEACLAQDVRGGQAVYLHADTSLSCRQCGFYAPILSNTNGDVGSLTLIGCDIQDTQPFRISGPAANMRYHLFGLRQLIPGAARTWFRPSGRVGYYDASGVAQDVWSCP